jgi:hypothetical protein
MSTGSGRLAADLVYRSADLVVILADSVIKVSRPAC